jgi:abhydrolase domain-containing protein 17
LPLYKIILIGEDGSHSELPNIPFLKVNCFKIEVLDLNNINSGNKKKDKRYLSSIFVRYEKAVSDYCVIFSHGNSTDIGYMIDSYLDLAYNCKINVLAYDYSGYGDL